MLEHNKLCIGIDLGTTNSCLACISEKANGELVPKVLDITRKVPIYGSNKFESRKAPTLPSCVYYREEENFRPYVGDLAKSQYYLRPHLTVKSVKSSMGSDSVPGLSEDVPDHTPAEVSARILSHMLAEAKKIFRQEINDVVITVPANFDSVMCQSTREAARLAGIAVSEEDGTDRTILLSEPNAVLYDLINQIHNGEIPDVILDLSKKLNILVFDIGGGTLDVTIHEVQRREDCADVLKVNEIATNRYTLLGGDDFDRFIAEAMFDRYVEQYKSHPQVVSQLKAKKNDVIPQFISYAEDLKKEINESHSSDDEDDAWGDFSDDHTVGGHIQGLNYSYDDSFTESELEEILMPLMGNSLKFDDYKNIASITDTNNIIYPVLDALKKAADKLNTQELKIDAVVLNGGMSRFYMVVDRLKEFFGFEPISILDPDQAVAKGAAIFHYYLHKHAEIQDEMIKVSAADSSVTKGLSSDVLKRHNIGIDFSNPIYNDSLYLGLRAGAVEELVKAGQTLPYDSQTYTGFAIPMNKTRFEFPIMVKELDGSYRCIAKSSIDLGRYYTEQMYLSFSIHMGTDKIISMQATVSTDEEGFNVTQTITDAKIVIDDGKEKTKSAKLIAKSGTVLNPHNELDSLKKVCEMLIKAESTKDQRKHKELSLRTREQVSSIAAAKNFDEFIPLILRALTNSDNQLFKLRLFVIARKTIELWSDEQKARLERACMAQLNSLLGGYNFYTNGNSISTNSQALYTLGFIASEKSLSSVRKLKNNTKYKVALIFCFAANEKYGVQDMIGLFADDAKALLRGSNNTYQHSVYYVGYALRKDKKVSSKVDYKAVIKLMVDAIESQRLNQSELIATVMALGWICNQTGTAIDPVSGELAAKAEKAIYDIATLYDSETVALAKRSTDIALKLIQGSVITPEEENYLLAKVNKLLNGEK